MDRNEIVELVRRLFCVEAREGLVDRNRLPKRNERYRQASRPARASWIEMDRVLRNAPRSLVEAREGLVDRNNRDTEIFCNFFVEAREGLVDRNSPAGASYTDFFRRGPRGPRG